jgi:hypothetical protein
MIKKLGDLNRNSYLITNPHNATGRTHSYERTRHKSLNSSFLRCIRERYLSIVHRTWPNGADDGVYACQNVFERCVIFDLANMDFNPTGFEL